LDFDNVGLSPDQFTDLVHEVCRGLTNDGFVVENREVFKGAMRSYVRFPKLLFDLDLSHDEEEKILIQMDTTSHDYHYESEVKLLNKLDVFAPIRVTPPSILLSQKIVAAMGRKRAKGRDFFDITFLWSFAQPDYGYLEHKLGVTTFSEVKALMAKTVGEFDFNALAADVSPFLFNPVDSKRVEMFMDFWKNAG
jgi:hypothetical protein